MKVLLISDYFFPFNPGGTEWSVFELAKSLKESLVDTKILTLNYGATEKEKYRDIDIIRLPFYKKLNTKRSIVNPFYQNNPFFFIYSAFHLVKLIRKEKPDIIHTHGKFLIPASIIAGKLTRTPVVLTVRDKQVLCSIGKCFFDKNRRKACNFYEYITSDFPWFYKNYVGKKNLLSFTYALIGVIWSRFAFSIIKSFLNKANRIVAISNSQREYLESNGFKDIITIYNSTEFIKPTTRIQKDKQVLFAGKLSNGKGANLLLQAAKIMNKGTKTNFIFAGEPDSSFKKQRSEFLKFIGGVNQQEIRGLYKKSSLTVMPSIYPEAFGRVAMESLAQGTPAIVTAIGALPEIVRDRVTGRVVKPDPGSLADAINDVLKNEKKYKNNIKKEYKRLKYKFMKKPLEDHLKLYKALTK